MERLYGAVAERGQSFDETFFRERSAAVLRSCAVDTTAAMHGPEILSFAFQTLRNMALATIRRERANCWQMVSMSDE